MAVVSSHGAPTTSTGSDVNYRGALVVVSSLFFMWGFCTVLNDALIPHLQSIFSLNYLQASLIQLAFFGSYFLFAQPASKVIEWIGYQRTMVVGLVIMAAGALLFLPAASTAKYGFFLSAQVVLAAGVTILQVAANPYVTILGPPETASSRLNMTQAFNTLGDTVAPYIGSVLILGGAGAAAVMPHDAAGAAAYRIQQAASVKLPYLVIAGILITLGIAIALYKFPRFEVTQDFRPGALAEKRDSVWRHPHVWLGALGIFIYVGAEVSVGSFLAKYIASPEIGHMTLESAAKMVTFYWGGMMLGRFAGSGMMQRIAPNRLLAVAGVGAAVVMLLTAMTSGHFALWSVLAVGLFNSIMFPTIFTLGVAEMGEMTGKASGLLIQAIVGGALIPVMMGHLADTVGLHRAMLLPFACYLFIIYYGLHGYRIYADEEQSHLEPTS